MAKTGRNSHFVQMDLQVADKKIAFSNRNDRSAFSLKTLGNTLSNSFLNYLSSSYL